MKNIYTLLFGLAFFSCSSESENTKDQMCCDITVEEAKQSYIDMYEGVLANENITGTQREEIQAEYDRVMEDPCGRYKEMLAGQGVTDCRNP